MWLGLLTFYFNFFFLCSSLDRNLPNIASSGVLKECWLGHLLTSIKIAPEKYATFVLCCFQSLTWNRKTFFPFFDEFFFSELSHLHFKNHLFGYCKLRASLHQKELFLSQLNNNYLCAVRSRAMFDRSTDPGNDWMVAQFVFLFLARPIFQETSTEMGIKIILMPIIILLSMLV